MGSFGATIRRACGPYERQVSELYRRMFIDLDDFSKLAATWSNGTRILEIGCGEGALAERLIRDYPNADYTGIDIIPHLGRMYEGETDRVEFCQITAQQLAQERPGQFDLIVISDVMHHVQRDIRAEIFEASKQLMAPEGMMIFKDWVRRPTPIHAAVYVADVYVGGDKNVEYMDLDTQRSLITEVFGADSIRKEATVAPWSQNHAFLVTSNTTEMCSS